jgi:hypothetical protein
VHLARNGGVFCAQAVIRALTVFYMRKYTRKKKPRNSVHGFLQIEWGFRLLNFAFFVFNMFARNRIIFPGDHFFGHCACVLFGHIEVASARAGIQADLNCGWLRHGMSPTGAASWPL